MFGKWLTVQALLDSEEIQSLFNEMGDFLIFVVSDLCQKGQSQVSQNDFLKIYDTYIETLKKGNVASEEMMRRYFSSIFTRTEEAIEKIAVSDKELVTIKEPVIQLQSHSLHYSPIDNKFRSMVFGKETISWGLQFSYPQVFENPKLKKIEPVKDSFANTLLFANLRKWIRHNTLPTSFLVNGTKINIPARIGKRCLSWINNHPQLQVEKIQVTRGLHS